MILQKLIIGSVIFIAAALHGAFGFAFVLIAVPLLSSFQDIRVTIPLISLFFVLLSGIRSVQLRNEFDYKKTIPLLIGAAFGIPLGIYLLSVVSERLMKSALGIVIILYSAHSLMFKRISFRPPEWSAYLFGFFSGVLGGAFNMTGPPVVLYAFTRMWTKTIIFGSLNFYFLITSIVVVVFHVMAGNMTREVTLSFITFLPALFAGMYLGGRIFIRVNDENYRNGLHILLTLAGAMLLK